MLYRELNVIKRHSRLEQTVTEENIITAKTKIKLIKKLINDNFYTIINNNIKEKLTTIDPKKSENMFRQIKKNFKKYTPLNLKMLKIPEN